MSGHENNSEQGYRKLSFWLDNVPGSLAPRPALEDDIEVDIAIVGGGYTGLWTALYLKQLDPGLGIAILEAEIAGFGASGRNGGWCAAYLSGIGQFLCQGQPGHGGQQHASHYSPQRHAPATYCPQV